MQVLFLYCLAVTFAQDKSVSMYSPTMSFKLSIFARRSSIYICITSFMVGLLVSQFTCDMYLTFNNIKYESSVLCGFIFLLILALQPTVGFSLLSYSLPFSSFFTLLSRPSYSHYLQIFFNACNPSLPWSPSNSHTYRFPL